MQIIFFKWSSAVNLIFPIKISLYLEGGIYKINILMAGYINKL